MISRYAVFCRVMECGSFTKAAQALGYSQSSVSQTVRSLEEELGVTLLDRRRGAIRLTADGEQLWPYLRAVAGAERALGEKRRELAGLENTTIRLGTFTSVSRDLLPETMEAFREKYPSVRFLLRQGEYTSITGWLLDGQVDLGFLNMDTGAGLEAKPLLRDRFFAVLPKGHPLAKRETVSLAELAAEPFILLDEGERSLLLEAFAEKGLAPQIEYTVTDDYSILAMVRRGLGVSAMYGLMLSGFEDEVAVRPIREQPERVIALAWRRWETLPLAARRFAQFLLRRSRGETGA